MYKSKEEIKQGTLVVGMKKTEQRNYPKGIQIRGQMAKNNIRQACLNHLATR